MSADQIVYLWASRTSVLVFAVCAISAGYGKRWDQMVTSTCFAIANFVIFCK